MKRTALASMLVLGGLLSLPVSAAEKGDWGLGGWGSRRGYRPGMGGPMFGLLHDGRMKEELGLTDEQSEKLRKLFSDSRKSSIRARAELKVKRMELHEIMMGDKADREAALKKVAEISDLRAQLMRQHVETMLAAKGILTPEQQKKAHALMAERWSHRGDGFRGRRGMGRGPGGWDGPGRPDAPDGPGGGPGGPSREFAPALEED